MSSVGADARSGGRSAVPRFFLMLSRGGGSMAMTSVCLDNDKIVGYVRGSGLDGIALRRGYPVLYAVGDCCARVIT